MSVKLSTLVYILNEYNPNSYRDFKNDKPGVVVPPPLPRAPNASQYRDISKDKPGVVGNQPVPGYREPGFRNAQMPPQPVVNKLRPTKDLGLPKQPNSQPINPQNDHLPFAKTLKPTPVDQQHKAQRDRWRGGDTNPEEVTPAQAMKSVLDYSSERLAALTKHLLELPPQKHLPVYQQMVENIINFYTQIANYAVKPEQKEMLLKAADALTVAYKQLPGYKPYKQTT
jgi:hypothetical protein